MVAINQRNGVGKETLNDEVGDSNAEHWPSEQELHSYSQSRQQTSTVSISEIVVKCLKQLTHLFEEESLQKQPDISPALWQDELGRLRVWAANIGAHQIGESSLDHRLREASHIKDQTLRLFERLQRAAQDLECFSYNSGSDDDFLGESDENEETELQSIYHAMRDTINNLFQMSMLIRRPAQHDRLLGTKRSDAAPFEPFDRQHVESKYPNADQAVLDRLGLAISQRRAVMRYRERHHMKLGQGLNQAIGDHPENLSTKLSDTVATDFIEMPEVHVDFESHSVVSQTSYAQTIVHGGEGITIPPPPRSSANGAPFECPYCFVIISITKRNTWARHVFNDIMPYVCIFPKCPTPHRLYESRREWFSHLRTEHSIASNSNSYNCSLCLSSLPSGKGFERHVGRHLEELALFALPRSDNDNEGASDIPDAASHDGDNSDDDESHIFGDDSEQETDPPGTRTSRQGVNVSKGKRENTNIHPGGSSRAADGGFKLEAENGPRIKVANPHGHEWLTQVSKDRVDEEVLRRLGHEFEETTRFYFVADYLKDEEIEELARLSGKGQDQDPRNTLEKSRVLEEAVEEPSSDILPQSLPSKSIGDSITASPAAYIRESPQIKKHNTHTPRNVASDSDSAPEEDSAPESDDSRDEELLQNPDRLPKLSQETEDPHEQIKDPGLEGLFSGLSLGP